MKKYISLSICGYCGKDTREIVGQEWDVEKVVLSGHANMLCRSCIKQLDEDIEDIAKKYLCQNPKRIINASEPSRTANMNQQQKRTGGGVK